MEVLHGPARANAQTPVAEDDQGLVSELTAQDDHGRVDLGTEVDTGSPPSPALGDQGSRHLRPGAGRQRGGCVSTPIVAAGRVGVRRAAELLQLRPARRSRKAARSAGSEPGSAAAGAGPGPPAPGGGEECPSPSAGGASCQAEKLGARLSAVYGRGKLRVVISRTQASLAGVVR